MRGGIVSYVMVTPSIIIHRNVTDVIIHRNVTDVMDRNFVCTYSLSVVDWVCRVEVRARLTTNQKC